VKNCTETTDFEGQPSFQKTFSSARDYSSKSWCTVVTHAA